MAREHTKDLTEILSDTEKLLEEGLRLLFQDDITFDEAPELEEPQSLSDYLDEMEDESWI